MFKYKPGEVFTKDILNKDNHKLFKVIIESLPRMVKKSGKSPRSTLLENGNVLIWNEMVQLYNTKEKIFSNSFKLGDKIVENMHLGREKLFYFGDYTYYTDK